MNYITPNNILNIGTHIGFYSYIKLSNKLLSLIIFWIVTLF